MIADKGYTVAYVKMPSISVTCQDADRRIRLASDPIGIVRSKVVRVDLQEGWGDADDLYRYQLENGDVVHDDECVVCGFGDDSKIITAALEHYAAWLRQSPTSESLHLAARSDKLFGAFTYDHTNQDRLITMPVAVAQDKP